MRTITVTPYRYSILRQRLINSTTGINWSVSFNAVGASRSHIWPVCSSSSRPVMKRVKGLVTENDLIRFTVHSNCTFNSRWMADNQYLNTFTHIIRKAEHLTYTRTTHSLSSVGGMVGSAGTIYFCFSCNLLTAIKSHLLPFSDQGLRYVTCSQL